MKLKDLEKRLKNEPTNLGLRVQVAGMMREAGRSVEAVELYRSVALAYRDQGRTQQAIAVCKSILEIAPEDAGCQGLITMLQQRASTPKTPTKPPPMAEQMRSQPRESQPPPPQAAGVAMRGSPMPAAPEVPSLRAPTSRPTSERPSVTPTTNERPLRATRPPPLVAPPLTPPLTAERQERQAQVTGPTTVHRRPEPDPRAPDTGRVTDPGRRSSFDETPLPPPMPYHMADRTSQPSKMSANELEVPGDTRPEAAPSGLGEAARRISSLITDGVPNSMDLSQELDTRQRPRIGPEELRKVTEPPPTGPVPPVDIIDEVVTDEQDILTPLPRGSEDAITVPPAAPPRPQGLTRPPLVPRPPASTKPPLVSKPALVGKPALVSKSSGTPSSIPPLPTPPRTISRPNVVSIPPKSVRPTPSITIPPKPPPPPPPPPPPKSVPPAPRDSDDEMTQPRDRTELDDENFDDFKKK